MNGLKLERYFRRLRDVNERMSQVNSRIEANNDKLGKEVSKTNVMVKSNNEETLRYLDTTKIRIA